MATRKKNFPFIKASTLVLNNTPLESPQTSPINQPPAKMDKANPSLFLMPTSIRQKAQITFTKGRAILINSTDQTLKEEFIVFRVTSQKRLDPH